MLHITIPSVLAVAYVAIGARHLNQQTGRSVLALGISLVAIAVHAIWLSSDLSLAVARVSIAQTLSMVALVFAVIAAAATRHENGRVIAGLLFLLAGITSALGIFGGSDAGTVHSSGWPLVAHIVFSIISYALLAVAALLAITMAWKDRQVRTGLPSALASRLPPLQALDSSLFITMLAGFVTLSLSIFSGLIFIEDIRSQHLTHKTVLTALSWLVFGVLLLGRWRFGWRGKIAVRWTLSGFGILLLAYFGSRLVLEMILNRTWG